MFIILLTVLLTEARFLIEKLCIAKKRKAHITIKPIHCSLGYCKRIHFSSHSFFHNLRTYALLYFLRRLFHSIYQSLQILFQIFFHVFHSSRPRARNDLTIALYTRSHTFQFNQRVIRTTEIRVGAKYVSSALFVRRARFLVIFSKRFGDNTPCTKKKKKNYEKKANRRRRVVTRVVVLYSIGRGDGANKKKEKKQ